MRNKLVIGLGILAAVVLAFVAIAHGQPAGLEIIPLYGTSSGADLLGKTCTGWPPGIGTPTIFLTGGGQIITCRGGLWTIFGAAYDSFQGQGAPVSLNATDQALFAFTNVPPISAASCLIVNYAISGSGLTAGTIKVWVDDVVISQPWTSGNAGPSPLSLGFTYCNSAGQSEQTLFYPGWDPKITGTIANSPTSDAWVNSPPSIDWSVPHTITITAAQASGGSVTPQYAHLSSRGN
jgi:hypothetical protein